MSTDAVKTRRDTREPDPLKAAGGVAGLAIATSNNPFC